MHDMPRAGRSARPARGRLVERSAHHRRFDDQADRKGAAQAIVRLTLQRGIGPGTQRRGRRGDDGGVSGWRTHATRTAYENPWLTLREDEVTKPDGTQGRYGVVEMRHASVFVVALTDADEVVLVDLFRYTTQSMSTEVPAGGSDGEDPLVAAKRELLEETGLEADSWKRLTTIYALNGVCNAPEHVFLARGMREVGGAELEQEGITGVRRVPWAETMRMVRDGEIDDSESLAALLCAAIELGRLG
jgi:8-oxo-dGTP pyrophosphatase MutT (NUDIX family)